MSGTMASKICPVCKTFTSSSNTTLNAHIDQCLSGESTIKRTANPKVIKNRIEPRKTRSMVDIYATAHYCTLEELDRRNGTNWASSWILPAEERKQKAPVNLENTENESQQKNTENENSVYADADGTKIQTLSKFSDSSSHVKIGEHPGSRKHTKGDQGSKFLSTKKKKKKKKRGKKWHKLQKCASDTKKFCSPRPHHKSEIIGEEQNIASEETSDKEAFTQHRKTHDQIKFNDSGTILRWVCSKRTGLKKKVNGKEYLRHSACTDEKKLRGENNETSLGNAYVKRGSLLMSPKSSGNPPSSPKTNMNVSSEPDDEYGEKLYLRKRARFSLLDSQALSEGNVTHLRDSKDHLNNKANPISSLSSQRVEMKKALTRNADSCTVNSKPSSNRHTFTSKVKRFSSLKKDLVSVSQASVPESKFSLKRKCLNLKKPRVHRASEFDEEAMVSQTAANEQNGSVENLSKVKARTEETSDKVIVRRTMVSKVRKDKVKFKISREEEAMILTRFKSAPEYHEHDADNKFDSFPGNVLAVAVSCKESAVKEVKFCEKDIVSEPASNMVDEEASMDKSSDVRFHDVAGCSDVQSDSRQFVQVNDGPFFGTEDSRCPVEPMLSGGQEVFCTDGGERNIEQNAYMSTELDSDDGPGNYYIEVDPILIPGPPGSFLPSPGHMASEEFQGNSSVTSQVQSSKDHPEFADRDSSNSSSATSAISNSNAANFDSRSSENFPLEPQNVQDEMRSRICGATTDALADNTKQDPSAVYGGAERLNSIEPTSNMMFHEREPFRFKNFQPCCCSEKEGTILGAAAALNYQVSPLLRQQTVSLIPQPASDEQMNDDANRKLDNCYLMSEVLSNGDLTGGTENVTPYPLGHISHKVSANSEVKFLFNSDGESASPSKSNSVLRLMGKDLMVVNKDENVLPQLRPSELLMMKSQGNPLCTASGVYSGNVQNKHSISSRPSEGPIFEQMPGNSVTQHVDVTLSNGCSNGYYGAPQRPTHASPPVLSDASLPASSCSSERLEYTGGCYIYPEQLIVMNKLGRALACDMEKAASPEQGQILGSSKQTIKELIVVHDAPESSADLATDAMHAVGMMKGSRTSAGNPVSAASDFNPRHANPIYGYQPHKSSPYGGSPPGQIGNLQTTPPMGVSSSPTKWNCVPKGSDLLQKRSFTSSSSPTYI